MCARLDTNEDGPDLDEPGMHAGKEPGADFAHGAQQT